MFGGANEGIKMHDRFGVSLYFLGAAGCLFSGFTLSGGVGIALCMIGGGMIGHAFAVYCRARMQ